MMDLNHIQNKWILPVFASIEQKFSAACKFTFEKYLMTWIKLYNTKLLLLICVVVELRLRSLKNISKYQSIKKLPTS